MAQASAPAPPPLLQCAASLSALPELAPLLAQHPAMLHATIAILAAPHASSGSRDASLAILEAVLDLDHPIQVANLHRNLGSTCSASACLALWTTVHGAAACSTGMHFPAVIQAMVGNI